MTYQLERQAIETYFAANTTGLSVGLDGHNFTPAVDTLQININSGAVRQGSTGLATQVRHAIGTAVITIYTDGGKGSAAWRGYAETLVAHFTDKTIDSAGAIITATADAFARFSPPQLGDDSHPYISANYPAAPFHVTQITAPFVRYVT